MKIAVTGHRPNKLNNDYDLTSELVLKIKSKIITIIDAFEPEKISLITGMALGIDTLFARIAIEKNISFTAYIPCVGQEKMWTQKSQDEYNSILQHELCTVHYTSKQTYQPYSMQLRNEAMVDSCNLLIAVWDGTSGGTKNCVDYARKNSKFIIYIDPKNLDETIVVNKGLI